ncbi:hypothetical protein [Bacillus timonensis]|uniref:hypothetical protein n=1 Tax=Bacillus timonensis TaxID=1033734 RepID=UPI00028A0A47|nr:hypothetical protein [Bacillus timonensis]
MVQNQVVASSWRGLLQYITNNLIGNGYYYWHLTELPVHKESKWGGIDKKFVKKYKTDKSKFQRARRKKDGLANFIYIRWQQFAFVFHTHGTVPSDVEYTDVFYDIREKPDEVKLHNGKKIRLRHKMIFLKIGLETGFDIQLSNNGKAHVKLSKDTYLGLKAIFHNTAIRRNTNSLKGVFAMVNGLPNYAGVVKQKKMLREYIVKQAEKNELRVIDKKTKKKRKMQYKDFYIYTKKDTVKVFDETK